MTDRDRIEFALHQINYEGPDQIRPLPEQDLFVAYGQRAPLGYIPVRVYERPPGLSDEQAEEWAKTIIKQLDEMYFRAEWQKSRSSR